MSQLTRGERAVTAGAGLLFALYTFAGRWGFSKLSNPDSRSIGNPALQVRFWCVLAIVALVIHDAASRGRGDGRHDLARKSHLAAFWAFALYFLLSFWWAPDLELAAAKAYELCLTAAATIALLRLASGELAAPVIHWFWAGVLALGLPLAALATRSFLGGGLGEDRMAVLGGGPNVFGRLMGLVALGCMYFWRERVRWRFVLPPALTLAVTLLLLSGSRGCFVAATAAVAALVATSFKSLGRAALPIALALLCGLAVLELTSLGEAAMQTYESRVHALLITERYTAGRGALYAAALSLAGTAPIFGGGLAGFAGRGLGVYPHNLFLEALSEGGGVGLALCAMTVLLPVLIGWRRGLDPLLVAGLTFCVAASQFSGDLYDSRNCFLFAAMLACAAPPVLLGASRGSCLQRSPA